MTSPEQRGAPRAERSLIARYRALESEAGPWFISPLKDVSLKGARFLTECEFKPGSRLVLHVALPSSREPRVLCATVNRIRLAADALWEVGVEFEALQPEDRRCLQEAVERVLRLRRRASDA